MSRMVVVMTSIFPPTPAVERFAALDDWRLIVAGDRKTPLDWKHPGVEYLSPDTQLASGFRFVKDLPWNHYCRKMVAYLVAMRNGAEVIVDTDDDNLPKPGWRLPAFKGPAKVTPADRGFVNMYRSFTAQAIWPRGLPLKRICEPSSILAENELVTREVNVGVWQGLADGDPDVDAIYRLTNNTPCYFDAREPVVLDRGTLCPFNSQNTAFVSALFPLLYLPAFVTFRFTDILRGLVAQPIMWSAGYQLGFHEATVVQERNPHDYLKDFESEVPCYLHADRVIECVAGAIEGTASVADNLVRAYEALHAKAIIERRELTLLDAWLTDIAAVARMATA